MKYYLAVALAILGAIIGAILTLMNDEDAIALAAIYYGFVGISFVIIGFGAYMFIVYVIDPYKGPGRSKITKQELEEYRVSRKKAKEQRMESLEFFVIGLMFIGVWYVLTTIFGSMTV